MKLWGRHRSGNDRAPAICVMGALRSGTNVVAATLERHWQVSAEFHAFGWKHAGVPVLAPSSGLSYPDLPILWICKHPLAWMVSMHRYLGETAGKGGSLSGERAFADFIRAPITIWDSRLKHSPRLRYDNPAQYWNAITMNLQTLDANRFNALGLNYEDILADPASLQAVEQLLPAKRRTKGDVTLPKQKMGRGRETAEDGNTAFDMAANSSQKYLEEYTAEDLGFLASRLDPWLLEARGYSLP